MNIAVLRPTGRYYFRPDSTLIREAADYYMPDGLDAVILTPCIYSKVKKAGKCIGARFADRYADNFGFGVLLDAAQGEPQEATCMDATSYLSGETSPMTEISGCSFELNVNGGVVFRQDGFSPETIYDALVTISRRSSLRAADLVAVCLSEGMEVKRGDNFSFAGCDVKIL